MRRRADVALPTGATLTVWGPEDGERRCLEVDRITARESSRYHDECFVVRVEFGEFDSCYFATREALAESMVDVGREMVRRVSHRLVDDLLTACGNDVAGAFQLASRPRRRGRSRDRDPLTCLHPATAARSRRAGLLVSDEVVESLREQIRRERSRGSLLHSYEPAEAATPPDAPPDLVQSFRDQVARSRLTYTYEQPTEEVRDWSGVVRRVVGPPTLSLDFDGGELSPEAIAAAFDVPPESMSPTGRLRTSRNGVRLEPLEVTK